MSIKQGSHKQKRKCKTKDILTKARRMALVYYCNPKYNYSMHKISEVLDVSMTTIQHWKRKDNWDFYKKHILEGVKETLVQEGIKDGVLTLQKITELQEDVISAGKKAGVENKDTAYRTAIKLEELATKKQLLNNPEVAKGVTVTDILMLASGDD